MRKNVTKLRYFCLTLLTLGLSACSSDALLDPKGTVALAEKKLLFTCLYLMLLVVIPVILLNFFYAWKYRANNTKAKYTPDWGHSTILEIVWWTIPCIIIGILGVITWVSSHRLDPYRPLKAEATIPPVVIQVIALEWKWLFIYPKEHIATVNFIQIPVNTPVRFLITSDAPMNSFQIPRLAGQIYAMAGMQTKLNIMATELGDYHGRSTNYSGAGFNGMNFITHVSSQKEFDQWVKRVQKSPQKLTLKKYDDLAKPTQYDAPQYFSAPANDLFNTVIMRFMMPPKVTP